MSVAGIIKALLLLTPLTLLICPVELTPTTPTYDPGPAVKDAGVTVLCKAVAVGAVALLWQLWPVPAERGSPAIQERK